MTPTTLAPQGTGAVPAVHSHLRIPADLGAVAFARATAACLLEREGWPAEASGRMLLTLSEALANAVEHGSPAGGIIDVELLVGRERSAALVTDQGRPGGHPPLLPPQAPPIDSLRGRGLLLMSQLSDRIAVDAAGAGTTVWFEVEQRSGTLPRPAAPAQAA